jgi:hypothetical protein
MYLNTILTKSTSFQEFFPQSFYKASTNGTMEKKWAENCYLVSKDLILFEEEDILDSE